jgi:phage tail sheath protein FI
MPALTYPGVYVEEIPSGVRTITGVATSITAFVGKAISGPLDQPTTIFSFADFVRQFGGLGYDYPMSYAVSDFFGNGGGQAIVVRIYKAPDGSSGKGQIAAGNLTLEAASPGKWSDGLSAAVTPVPKNNTNDQVAKGFGLAGAEDLFNLSVMLNAGGQVSREQFLNLTLKDVPGSGRAQRVDRALLSSQFVRIPVGQDGNPILPSSASPPPAASGAPPPGNTPPSGNAPPAGGAPASPGGATAPAATAPAPATTTTTPPSGNDGGTVGDDEYLGGADPNPKKGIFALDGVDIFNLLCIPPAGRGGDTSPKIYQKALDYCQKRRAMLIVDPPKAWGSPAGTAINSPQQVLDTLNLTGPNARNAAFYYPRVITPDSLDQTDTFVPCGLVAGAMAATDSQRGVWKAPAGLDATLSGITRLADKLTNDENGVLNQLGINCLRNFPIYGNVVWGARTLRGADQVGDEYKYIPVRRLALYIEESLFRGTHWVVFEPNDEPLWAQIRLNSGAFMHNLFVKGAFQGQTPAAAYFVKCDKDTTTQNDIDLGIVNIRVGFAPLKPAEFVVLQIQQIAGDILT